VDIGSGLAIAAGRVGTDGAVEVDATSDGTDVVAENVDAVVLRLEGIEDDATVAPARSHGFGGDAIRMSKKNPSSTFCTKLRANIVIRTNSRCERLIEARILRGQLVGD
jgi:hypothetical protein